MEKIFTIFVSQKGNRGTGLGLPVSQKILKEHGGRIRVESQAGVGSRFILELPAVAPDSQRPRRGLAGRHDALAGCSRMHRSRLRLHLPLLSRQPAPPARAHEGVVALFLADGRRLAVAGQNQRVVGQRKEFA